jgi:sugar lactone lactonase YvrE
VSSLKSNHQARRCPKTTGFIRSILRCRWLVFLYPFVGLAALTWFLVRVIPKPSRAAYPCQRVAFPLASGFIVWLLGITGSAVAFRKAKRAFARARYVLAAICIALSFGFIWAAMNNADEEIVYAHEPIVHNAPMGDAKGVYPGRVAWINDPNATNWDSSGPPDWYENTCTDPDVVAEMLSKGIRTLSGKSTDAQAWDAIFKDFNQQHGKGYVGYTPGEKVAIKINFVMMYDGGENPSPWVSGDKPTARRDRIDCSPQLAIALAKQLTDVVGASASDITFAEVTMTIANYWYNMVSTECPGIKFVVREGYPLPGREECVYDTSTPFHWSDPDEDNFIGVTEDDFIPARISEADYLINFAILKSHTDAGMTVCGKNHFGSLRTPWESGTPYYNMHASRPSEVPGMGHYRCIVDLMGHPKLGGKTLLALIDGLYAGTGWDSLPYKWNMSPFNGDWPSSIFLSQDQVAADSVAFDFMDCEWNNTDYTQRDGYNQRPGTDDYLHEAALIPDPCSGTEYDPNGDGIGLTESLGVHEHWNNASDKQYSRNLDPVDGTGIELVTQSSVFGDFNIDGVVNFIDFAKFAAAWRSEPGDGNWDADCDISLPSDNVIDEKDLAIFCSNWLNITVMDLIKPGATLQEVYSDTSTSFEGPMWDPGSGKLFFSKRTSPYQTLRLDSPGNVTVWLNNSPETNGMFLSLEGRMLACDENPRQVSSHRIDEGGPADSQVLADTSDGFTKKPNDLCQLTNGNIYFTTPDWNWGVTPAQQGTWLLEPDGTVTQVNNTINQPNGIITSLDETKLYVSEASGNPAYQRWWVFNIASDGTLDAGSVFFNPASPPTTSNVPDGMTIDELGNLYFSGLGGVWIVSPQGEQLEFIDTPEAIYNVAFGGPNGRTLYMTCEDKVYSLAMNVRGGGNHSW